MEIELLKCQRCGHEWYQRTPEKPNRCAGCKAPYWWRPARVAKPRKEPASIGRAHQMPQLLALEPGQSFISPWRRDKYGIDSYTNHAASIYAKRHGWTIRTESTPSGLRISRLS